MISVLFNDYVLGRNTDKSTLLACMGAMIKMFDPYLNYLLHERQLVEATEFLKNKMILECAYKSLIKNGIDYHKLEAEIDQATSCVEAIASKLSLDKKLRWELTMFSNLLQELITMRKALNQLNNSTGEKVWDKLMHVEQESSV